MSESGVARQSFAGARATVESPWIDDPRRSPAFLASPRARRHPRKITQTGDTPSRGLLVEIRRSLSKGTTSVARLVERSLEAWERHKDLNPLAHLDAEGALAEAERLDGELRAGRIRGPLHGVPITVKDVIDVAGMPTRGGSAAYYDLPRRDAEAVSRLRAAGAIVLGKATTHEFALGVTTPQARNPHDAARIPGGSSGGSAIAVATGVGVASVGTDTRASIRIPSALTGTVGLRPTLGTVPTGGIIPLSWTMDAVGPITATVPDAALVVDALVGQPSNLSGYAGSPVEGLRVGVPESGFADCHPGVVEAVENALAALGSLGVSVSPVARPTEEDFALANAAGLILSRTEAAAFHESIGTDLDECWPETRDQLVEAEAVPARVYIDAHRCRAQLTAELVAIFDDVDVLAMPTSPVPAPRVERANDYLTILSRNCIPWSFVGFPALSLPCHDGAEGLPVGLQLVAPPHEESLLVALGSAYEAASAEGAEEGRWSDDR